MVTVLCAVPTPRYLFILLISNWALKNTQQGKRKQRHRIKSWFHLVPLQTAARIWHSFIAERPVQIPRCVHAHIHPSPVSVRSSCPYQIGAPKSLLSQFHLILTKPDTFCNFWLIVSEEPLLEVLGSPLLLAFVKKNHWDSVLFSTWLVFIRCSPPLLLGWRGR